jgi:predicted LPLAT superfamily acyltransferase
VSAVWAEATEVGAVTGMWLMYQVNRVLGRWPFRLVLAPVVLYYVFKQRLARSASRSYLTRLEDRTHALGHAPGWLDTFRHVRLFAETLLDKALAVSGRYHFEAMTFEGREVMVESFAQKRGGLLLTSHMGCLEVLRSAAERRVGLKLNVLVHTRHAERFNSVLRRLDPTTEVNLLQVTDFNPAVAAMLAERVGQGEFIVIAGDRVPVDGRNVVKAPFLGAEAPFPVGPWVLAHALKCQVIFITALHRGRSYHVRFERFREKVELPRGSRDAAVRELVVDYAKRLEDHCRQSPYDWFNFYDFWADVNDAPLA